MAALASAPAVAAPSDPAAADTPAGAAPAGQAGAPAPATAVPAAPAAATLAVNGVTQQVAVDGRFPAADPVFTLVALGADTVQIGVVDGSAAGGRQTVTLERDRSLTLLDTSTGARYELRLVSLP